MQAIGRQINGIEPQFNVSAQEQVADMVVMEEIVVIGLVEEAVDILEREEMEYIIEEMYLLVEAVDMEMVVNMVKFLDMVEEEQQHKMVVQAYA